MIFARAARSQKASTKVAQVTADDTDGLELTIKEGYHGKRKCPLWIVQMSRRVDRQAYRELNVKAKQFGGWYSSFKKADAGFQFLAEESAQKFAGLLSGDADRTDHLKARKERRDESAAERLTRLATKMHAEAEEVIEYARTQGCNRRNTAGRWP